MNETRIPVTTIAAVAAWVVCGLLAIGAVVASTMNRSVAMMLAMFSVIASIAAATLVGRSYMIRICALIRALHGGDVVAVDGERRPGPELHPLR